MSTVDFSLYQKLYIHSDNSFITSTFSLNTAPDSVKLKKATEQEKTSYAEHNFEYWQAVGDFLWSSLL